MCVCVCVILCVFLEHKTKKEAVAKNAGKVCSFGVLQPVCFSLHGPSSTGWGWRVSLSPQGPGAIGTSKLLVTTGPGIQLNTHGDKLTQMHTHIQTSPKTEIEGQINGVFICWRGPRPLHSGQSFCVSVCACVYEYVWVCECTVRRNLVCLQKEKDTLIVNLYVNMFVYLCVFVCFSEMLNAAYGCGLSLMDADCGTTLLGCLLVCETMCQWTDKGRGMHTAGNVLFDRYSRCLDTHVMLQGREISAQNKGWSSLYLS